MTGSLRAWVSALGAVAALAMPLFGCGGGGERKAPVFQDARWGYSVRFPGTWYRAAKPVSPKLRDPREILALATFPLPRYRPTNCEAFGGSARTEMGRYDVFLTVLERGYDRDSEWLDFPPRPEHFGPTEPRPGEHGCGDPLGATVFWRRFSDAGRHFYTLVVIGADAPESAREQAWGILDSLRFDPDRRPTWPASG
jgi:hypothetical protein